MRPPPKRAKKASFPQAVRVSRAPKLHTKMMPHPPLSLDRGGQRRRSGHCHHPSATLTSAESFRLVPAGKPFNVTTTCQSTAVPVQKMEFGSLSNLASQYIAYTLRHRLGLEVSLSMRVELVRVLLAHVAPLHCFGLHLGHVFWGKIAYEPVAAWRVGAPRIRRGKRSIGAAGVSHTHQNTMLYFGLPFITLFSTITKR